MNESQNRSSVRPGRVPFTAKNKNTSALFTSMPSTPTCAVENYNSPPKTEEVIALKQKRKAEKGRSIATCRDTTQLHTERKRVSSSDSLQK